MANFGEVRVHRASPQGMYGSGNIDVWRDGSKVRAKGTTKLRISSSSEYGYHYAAAIYWKGSEHTYWAIKDNNNSGSGKTYTANFDVTINDNSAGELALMYLCCGAGNHDGQLHNRNTCDATPVATPNYKIWSTQVAAGYKTPTIAINNITSIGLHNKPSIQAHVNANTSGDDNATTVTWTVNGKDYAAYGYHNTTNIGNNEGYLSDANHPDRLATPYNYFRPSNAGVGEASSFTIKVTRRHNSTGKSADKSGTSRTYRLPKIQSLTVSPTNMSGYGNAQVSWQTNASYWSSTYEQNFKTYLELSTDNYSSEETDNNPTKRDSNSLSTRTITLGREYIERHVSTSQRNNNDSLSATLRVRRRNISASNNATSRGNVDAVSNSVSINIRFKPKYSPKSLIFKKNSSNGTILNPEDTVIISQSSQYYCKDVYVSWEYPNDADGGIIDGYIVRIYNDKTGELVKTYTVSAKDKYSASKLVPTADLVRAQLNRISITAYYTKPNGTKAEGPALESKFVFPVSALGTPTIVAPANNSEWLFKSFRVLFQLPDDEDYSYYDSEIRNNYVYRDIQLRVNNSVIYQWSSDKSIYSTSTLAYKRKMIVNPSLKSNYPNATSYTLQVRVRKNYGFNQSDAEESWSNWSSAVTVNIRSDSFSVNKGDLIMASHYNTLQPLCARMKKTYPLPTSSITCLTVKRGDIIYASDYNAPYADIKGVETSVNSYGPFDSDRDAVKFPVIPDFTPIRGEFITALSIDDEFPGRNYIRLMHDYANMLK